MTGNSDNNTIDFALMDILVERNPDLDDKDLLALYQRHANSDKDETIELLTGKITNRTKKLFNLATNEKAPETAHSRASYKIGQRLQSGGQSDVFVAHRDDKAFHKKVVIKRMHHTVAQEIDQTHLLQEMQILANLKHPNIITILDAGIDETQHPWMILEYIDGQHLDEYIQNNALSTKSIIKLLTDIANALLYVHQQGVYHLDIKPSNILVEKSDGRIRPVIIDFGIADMSHDSSKQDPAMIMATPAFAAPEQLNPGGIKIDHQSDIFSYGKLLKHVLRDHVSLDADLRSIINCCCQKNKSLRYLSMQQLYKDLNHYLNGRPVSVRQLSWLQRLRKMVLRNNKAYSIGAIISIIICSLLLYVWQQQVNSKNQQQQSGAINQHYWQQAQSITSDIAMLFAKPTQNIEKSYAHLQKRYDDLALALSHENLEIDHMPMVLTASRLGRPLAAQYHLQNVIGLRKNDSDVLVSMAKNHFNLYHLYSQEVSKHEEPQLQDSHLRALRKKWIIPALSLLKQAQNQNKKEDPVIKSLMLYHQGLASEALTALTETRLDNVWPVEQLQLSAQILKDAAQQALFEGEKNKAIEQINASVSAIKHAHNIARSDPLVAKQWCQLEAFAAPIDLSLAKDITGGCALLLTLLPNNIDAIELAANTICVTAQKTLENGDNPLPLIDQTSTLLSRIDTEPSAEHHHNLGMLTAMRARWQTISGQNGMQSSLQAIEYYRLAAKKNVGDYHMQMNLADTLYDFANLYYTAYHQSENMFEESEYWLKQLTKHPQSNVFLYSKLVSVLTDHSYRRYKSNLKADEMLKRANSAFNQLNELWPNNSNAVVAGAYLYWTYADYQVFNHEDPEPYFSLAMQYFEMALLDDPEGWVMRYNFISLLLIGAHYQLELGNDQQEPLQKIHKQLNILKQQVSEEINLHSHFGYYHNLLAIQSAIEMKSPDVYLQQARQLNLHSVNSEIDRYAGLTHLATTLILMVQHAPHLSLQKDVELLKEGLKEFPEHHQLRAQYGRLLLTMAQSNIAQKTQMLTISYEQLSRAIQANPLLNKRFIADLNEVQKLRSTPQNH